MESVWKFVCCLTWTSETKLHYECRVAFTLLSSSSFCSLLSSSTCHPVITSPLFLPLFLSLCRLSRRQGGNRPPQLNEWFNRERERDWHSFPKRWRRKESEDSEGGRKQMTKGKMRESVERVSSPGREIRERERMSCHFSGVQVAACYSAE